MHGVASLAFTADGTGGASARTRLTNLAQKAPLRVLFPQERACGVLQAVLITTSGGMAGGDIYAIDVAVADGAAILVTSQAAEKVYRSTGAETRIDVTLQAHGASWLEWMPQETILFNASRLHRQTRLELAADARFLGGEMLVFGRTAHGETLRQGSLRDGWQIRIDGRLIWRDALGLDGDIGALLNRIAGFDGAVAVTTLLYVAGDAPAHLPAVRTLIGKILAASGEPGPGGYLRLAATCVNGVLLVRGLASDSRVLRRAVLACWSALRVLVAGLPGDLPRVWLT